MKALLILFAAFCLTACGTMAYKDMTPDQIRATAGTTSCTQVSGLYGKASTIAINADDTKKGATSKGKMQITCGDATMVIEAEVGVPVPAGASTTTTTVVTPALASAPAPSK